MRLGGGRGLSQLTKFGWPGRLLSPRDRHVPWWDEKRFNKSYLIEHDTFERVRPLLDVVGLATNMGGMGACVLVTWRVKKAELVALLHIVLLFYK